jgi:hypothetical protein
MDPLHRGVVSIIAYVEYPYPEVLHLRAKLFADFKFFTIMYVERMYPTLHNFPLF